MCEESEPRGRASGAVGAREADAVASPGAVSLGGSELAVVR